MPGPKAVGPQHGINLTLKESYETSLTPKMKELFVSELGCSDQTSYSLLSKIMQENVTYRPSHNATVIFQASCPFNIQYSWLFNSLRRLPKQPQCYN